MQIHFLLALPLFIQSFFTVISSNHNAVVLIEAFISDELWLYYVRQTIEKHTFNKKYLGTSQTAV